MEIICRNEFLDNGIIMRGTIIKDDFNIAKKPPLMNQRFSIGPAYIEAYWLESMINIAGIVLSSNVLNMVRSLIPYRNKLIFGTNINDNYIYRYLSIDHLMESSSLQKFVTIATDSNWQPYYYNTLNFLMKKETLKKSDKVFSNIVAIINGAFPKESKNNLNLFIRNAFSAEVESDFQARFLRYIRSFLS